MIVALVLVGGWRLAWLDGLLLAGFGLTITTQVCLFALVQSRVAPEMAGRAMSAMNIFFFGGAAVLQGADRGGGGLGRGGDGAADAGRRAGAGLPGVPVAGAPPPGGLNGAARSVQHRLRAATTPEAAATRRDADQDVAARAAQGDRALTGC